MNTDIINIEIVPGKFKRNKNTLVKEKKSFLERIEVIEKPNYYKNHNIKYFTIAQIKTLISNVNNPFHHMILNLLFETGGRISEVLNIKYKDIDFTTRRLIIKTVKTRREGSYRILSLSADLLLEISLYKDKLGFEKNDYVVSRKGYKPITTQTVDNMIYKKVSKILGKEFIPLAHAHTFRHSRAIFLLESGVNLSMLKTFLGHINITNTLIYLQYSTTDFCTAMDKANDIYKSM